MKKDKTLSSIASEVDSVLDQVFDILHGGADRVLAAYRQGAQDGRVTPRDLHELRPGFLETLARVPAFQGTGFVADPQALRDVERYEEWWHRGVDGHPRFLDLPMEPGGANTYNYVDMPYFTGARSGSDTIAGPYLDFAGSELYVLTFASPVEFDGSFIGVSAADVPVGSFEKLVARHLLRSERPVVIVNAEGRVVASSSAAFAPGDRHRSESGAATPVGGPGVQWQVTYAVGDQPERI